MFSCVQHCRYSTVQYSTVQTAETVDTLELLAANSTDLLE